jgi:hypothetical protein
MIPSLIAFFPAFFTTLVVFILTVGIQTVNGSSNTTTGIAIPNATLPGVDNSYENENEAGKTQAQNCQMPPCPPGEMCIQVCPETSQK